MYDYSRLPTLVLNQIFGYLSVKERVRCKGVCRAWREEIELREAKNDTLVLHLCPYLWNIRWAHTNNRRLMKYENSFEMKRLSFLKHPLTRSLLKKTKKLAVLNYHLNTLDPKLRELHRYLGYFDQCEELEIRNFIFEEVRLVIDKETNYPHLFQFLRCYPFVKTLCIHASKVKANHIVDKLHVLLPSLRDLCIIEEPSTAKGRPSDALKLDLTFLRLLNLVYFRLKSTCLSVEFVRRVAAKRGPYLVGLHFETMLNHNIVICFRPEGPPALLDQTCGLSTPYSSIEELISAMQKDPHLSTFL